MASLVSTFIVDFVIINPGASPIRSGWTSCYNWCARTYRQSMGNYPLQKGKLPFLNRDLGMTLRVIIEFVT